MKPEPQFYKPAEACRVAEVAPYVLRYWETEFQALSEGKEKGTARLYSSRDVKIISRIRELLYDEGFTVAGAKKRLDAEISEGRFDEGLKSAASRAEQKRAGRTSGPESAVETANPVFLAEAHPPAKDAPPPADFPERMRVVKELKEIVKMLGSSRKKG